MDYMLKAYRNSIRQFEDPAASEGTKFRLLKLQNKLAFDIARIKFAPIDSFVWKIKDTTRYFDHFHAEKL